MKTANFTENVMAVTSHIRLVPTDVLPLYNHYMTTGYLRRNKAIFKCAPL